MAVNKGFTLLELMVVIAIMAVAAVLAGPRFAGAIETIRLQAAVRDMASGLRSARTQALRERQDAGMIINVKTGEYRLTTSDGLHSIPGAAKLGLVTGGTDILSGDQGRIVFFPDGSSNGGRVTLSQNGRKFRVDVNWLTGRVRILDD